MHRLTTPLGAVRPADASRSARRSTWCAPPCRSSSWTSFNAGHLTPVYFGSAIKDIGVADLLDGLAAYGPQPRAQPADKPRGARRRSRT